MSARWSVASARRLLRRHVVQRAHDGSDNRAAARTAHGTSDAEIRDERVVLFVEEDVGGLEVAVHDAGFMSRDKSGRNLAGERERPRDGEAPLSLENGRQIRAVHIRHRDVLDAVNLPEVVDADDVLVGDVARQEQFAFEAAFEIAGDGWIGHRLGADHLDGNDNRQLVVPRLVDGAHSANTQLTDEVIPTSETCAGLEGGGRGTLRWRCRHPTSRLISGNDCRSRVGIRLATRTRRNRQVSSVESAGKGVGVSVAVATAVTPSEVRSGTYGIRRMAALVTDTLRGGHLGAAMRAHHQRGPPLRSRAKRPLLRGLGEATT